MRYIRNGLTITLDTEQEIEDLMNIVEFAFDYEAEHKGSLFGLIFYFAKGNIL